jgi:hypothetical protein
MKTALFHRLFHRFLWKIVETVASHKEPDVASQIIR